MLVPALLDFHLGKQHRRSYCCNGHLPALRSTNTVEDFGLISGRQNPRQRRQRRTHNIHPAHQFVRTPVGVHPVYQHRQDLERLRQRSRCQRKTALNVIEIQSVRLPLFFYFIDQLLPHFRFGHRFCRSHDQVSLAPRGHPAGLVSPVSVRLAEILDRHARHKKVLQHPFPTHPPPPPPSPLLFHILSPPPCLPPPL